MAFYHLLMNFELYFLKLQFKDITAVKPLVQLYTVCCTLVPPNGVLPATYELQNEVIKTLLAFTQPDLSQLSIADSDFEGRKNIEFSK